MPDKSKPPVIVWFRRDLRTDDNAALSAAADSGQPVVTLYIREAADGTGPLGAAQDWWLHHSLTTLGTSLRALGTPLILRSGDAGKVLDDLIEETGAETVYWNRRHDPAGIEIDTDIKASLKGRGLAAKSFAGELLHDPTRLLTGEKKPYRVYTPFWRAFERDGEPHEPIDAPEKLVALHPAPKSEALDDWNLLPSKPDWATTFSDIWTPGEDAARERLETFVDGAINGYQAKRDHPSIDATSMLSPHLAMGEISPARVWHATRGLKAPTDDVIHFRKELVWREFCHHLHFHFPALAEKNWNDRFDAFPWEGSTKEFKAWTRGKTGYPIVDAGMRQLWQHGFMHNRVRMITASFLIKHLMIDWRRGEQWFRDTLVDADAASNAANWQWVAGSGADASPFFRIFNPILQGEKFDPDGTYVRRFVPELEKLDAAFIHKPFDAPESVLKKAGVVLGKTYPRPLVDHAKARERALGAYKTLKDG
ncbi:DNA photolyase family protein [Shinella curvata]|uniref:DNA photolyase family protein n=1 Tax=Shinella curvata TaxID=1817964 RepID=A0ABT8X9X7_9HYPH|nr:deoxyribodipyrimidine photo-lyase [Shinella curvata]MCJ8055065.1 DNA photolyase family protein [Shinella curvata]MDO6120539.1 DNA photolyase family protein [Shinella curvata]